ncbi:MAG: methylmalonyl-CoA mutase family protein [Rhodoplanes sp.]|uniref:fused isobutyryl-CoA mutase/GTPase IcmF n=1 Tax=Rhodoplanes sp. TaxID=1968906 RepID=UPI0018562EEF|nr:fused isobutyryl-CoA mutase/GTPase IcmF [Rhodoplanes sp.]NVO13995.1 methylmalonyl-CoA mutase family protein [Rhodoplanes sp.]
MNQPTSTATTVTGATRISPAPQVPAATAYRPRHKLRFVTAASLFDGHDASINLMRRILQSGGAEVIHLGHNRSVEEIVDAALQEDVQGIAVTSYQGGHIEFFGYMIDLLRQAGASDIKVFGGGGGVIVPAEVAALHARGVERIYTPQDGQAMGLQGMIDDVMARADVDLCARLPADPLAFTRGDRRALARIITACENEACPAEIRAVLVDAGQRQVPVLGLTGTGGSGKSSLTDELLRRFRLDHQDALKIAVLAVDPSRRRSGGALLGDRIRMNALHHPNIYMRSLATREAGSALSRAVPDAVAACKAAGFDLVIVETSGIGQGDTAITGIADLSVYVMTPEFGAATQLEKIDMLDFADFVAINKFERRGAEDALHDVRKQVQRNRGLFDRRPEDMPVYGTIAARFDDDGVTALYQAIADRLAGLGLPGGERRLPRVSVRQASAARAVVPPERSRYLADVAETVRAHHRHAAAQCAVARDRQALLRSRALLQTCGGADADITALIASKEVQLDPESRDLLAAWPATVERYRGTEMITAAPGRETRNGLVQTTLSGTPVPKVALPRWQDDGEILAWLLRENVPGAFPFTAGVFAFKRESEDPTRMFAGEGDAFRTNRRFHMLSEGMPAKRLSTAFDSVTLYGADPDERPDIFGKIGNSGVSIATLDDMKVLYSGFDLCDPATSVSMTINGPAPVILAMFLDTAIDQQRGLFRDREGRDPTDAEAAALRAKTLATVRGTVQADILKEDQGQNTCIFSTDFALRLMGDVQAYFVENAIRNFYSVSISGYHIAEAGANPISQLAFTLANGFTYVEAYLARGMCIDDFAPNLSFFFSNGMDPEYAVIGRVARRIWAIAMKHRYGGNERSQKLKYHIQTSGRSLHAQEMAFNDIRTTLQALLAIYDNCNSLHTNAFDEAVTTPTEDSVRRALAIQLVLNREWGVAKNQNPNQGSFLIEELTDLVEEAVLREFDAIAARGGVLGAMETGYQRSRIQDESLAYEQMKHDGSLPIVGVNTFLRAMPEAAADFSCGLVRSTAEEKHSQITRLRDFQSRHAAESRPALARLQAAATRGDNMFAVLMDAVRCCSLGQIATALFEVGGQYRRNV